MTDLIGGYGDLAREAGSVAMADQDGEDRRIQVPERGPLARLIGHRAATEPVEVDWFADGFLLTLEGQPLTRSLGAFAGLFWTLLIALWPLAVVFDLAFGSQPMWPTWAASLNSLVGAVACVGLLVTVPAGVTGWLVRRVWRIELTPHRLVVRNRVGRVWRIFQLEEIAIRNVGGWLEIDEAGTTHRLDATRYDPEEIAAVVDVLQDAVAVRSQPESASDKVRRLEAMDSLRKLTERG